MQFEQSERLGVFGFELKVKNMLPSYDLNKIKFAKNKPTFEKVVGLYEVKKLTEFKTEISSNFPFLSK